MINKAEPFKSVAASQLKVSFWQAAEKLSNHREIEQIAIIRTGPPSPTIQMAVAALNVNRHDLCSGLNLSLSTVNRRIKDGKLLDTVASERLSRLMQIALLARDLFESDELAARWLSTPNGALGDVNPFTLCDTELGARQIRRILRAIEWGHAA